MSIKTVWYSIIVAIQGSWVNVSAKFALQKVWTGLQSSKFAKFSLQIVWPCFQCLHCKWFQQSCKVWSITWIWPACKSIVTTWSAPAADRRSATSLIKVSMVVMIGSWSVGSGAKLVTPYLAVLQLVLQWLWWLWSLVTWRWWKVLNWWRLTWPWWASSACPPCQHAQTGSWGWPLWSRLERRFVIVAMPFNLKFVKLLMWWWLARKGGSTIVQNLCSVNRNR